MELYTSSVSDEMRAIMADARREAGARQTPYVDIEHLSLALFKLPEDSIAQHMLVHFGADTAALYQQIAAGVGVERGTPVDIKGLTRATQEAIGRSIQVMQEFQHSAINSGHLLISLMAESTGLVHDALADTPLDVQAMRDYMRTITAPAAGPANDATSIGRPIMGRRKTSPRAAEQQTEFVLVPTRQTRAARPQPAGRWGNMPWIVAGIALLVAYMALALPGSSVFTFFFVLVGWIFSLTLHEFSHALVAYLGGDHTVRDKGYLTFNPLKYTHPLLSIIMPLLFLAMGGIGLPGGAVYIERHRLRSQWWGAAVSAAGPTANLIFAVLLALPFFVGLVDVDSIVTKVVYQDAVNEQLRQNPELSEATLYRLIGLTPPSDNIWSNVQLWSAVAFLAVLQVTAVLLNLIPIPPLDGFGIIEPLLDERTRQTFRQIGFSGGIILVFLLLWMVEPVEREFWNTVYDVTHTLDIPNWLGGMGYDDFMFWRDQ